MRPLPESIPGGLLLGALLVVTIFSDRPRARRERRLSERAGRGRRDRRRRRTRAGTRFYTHAPEGTSPLKTWLVFEVVGVLFGGFLSGVVSDRLALFTERPPHVRRSRRLMAALTGGALFGLGAQLARGCTSGAALSGMAVMSFGGILTMLAIFGSAYGVAFFFRRLWIPAPEASHGTARS